MELDSNNIEAALNRLEAELDEQYRKTSAGQRRKITMVKEGVTEARKRIREMVSDPESRIPEQAPNILEVADVIHNEYCKHPMVDHTGHVESIARRITEHIEILRLASRPDSEIDTSDIPEVKDFSGAVRGKFFRGEQALLSDQDAEALLKNLADGFFHYWEDTGRVPIGQERMEMIDHILRETPLPSRKLALAGK